jgi:archaemetzincin
MNGRVVVPLAFAISTVIGGLALAAFEPPSKEVRQSAAGSLVTLDAKMRRAFSDAGEFQPKKEPRLMDWLAQHEEAGQTYGQYLASRPNIPDRARKKLYILPIGEFEKGIAPDLGLLREYTAAYYHPLEVEMLPVVADKEVPAKERINPMSAKKQWRSPDILEWLKKRLPGDAYAMIAVTMTDLYPDESWNFVFGQASVRARVGIFSFARYHPAWFGHKGDAAAEALVLRRASKVLTHEMGHMFGIRHCIHYECNMNGANSLEEADSTPMELCPVCLRKLQFAIRFDPLDRYQKLKCFQAANGMDAEAGWIRSRIESIEAAK